MIRDRKGGPFGWLIERYVARKVRRAFRGVWLRGEVPPQDGGLLLYGNHSSFWDGFVIQQLSKQIGWDGYALMDEQNVARYPFHSRLGAISVRPGDPRSAVETIRYLKQVLRRPTGVVFVFPEGVSRPGALELGPLQRGVEVIAKAASVRCVPLSIRYAFLEHEHPDVLIDIGVPHAAGALSVFTERLTALHAQTMAARSTEGFTRLLVGRSSVQDRWDAARALTAGRG